MNVAARSSVPSVERSGRWLIVRFDRAHDVLSWAIVGGGRRRASAVAWYEVSPEDLRPPVDPAKLLDERLQRAALGGAVGLMTSRRLDSFQEATAIWGDVSARTIATVGLGNALSVGDPPGPAGRIGTINVLCIASVPLTEEAQLEAAAIAVEARTVAVVESSVASPLTDRMATGTGTDCLVIASPVGPRAPARYAGKHTDLGHVIGASVREAVVAGARDWLDERHRGVVRRAEGPSRWNR